MAVTLQPEKPRRNAGPSWGYAFLRITDRFTPHSVFRVLVAMGTTVALVCMPKQRRCAVTYWRALFGKTPGPGQIWRQFFAFAESFIEILRLGRGVKHHFEYIEGVDADAFRTLAASDHPALFGTFHVGNSDLLGYVLTHYNRSVHIIRTQVENSNDTRWLGERFSEGVTFIWVDRPDAMLFAIKEAIDLGHSLAMKCDRLEQSSRREAFWFLGRHRLFPFAIYHLALIFDLPVAFAMAWPQGCGHSLLSTSSVFHPDPSVDRETNLKRAKHHFQTVLGDLESRLQRQPAQWFNFIPLNPEIEQGTVSYMNGKKP